MSWVVALLVQTATLPAGAAIDFDLRATATTKKCGHDGDEIVVCGNTGGNEAFRVRPLLGDFEEKRLKAETQIGPVKAGVETENVGMPGGETSKRVMVRLKMPF